MVDSARMLVCAGCSAQVHLCRRCDRGQRYCSRSCSGVARRLAEGQAGRRYQCSRRGRLTHAARSMRWRMRRLSLGLNTQSVAVQPVDDANRVTHQGCLGGPADAPLVAWTNDPTEVSVTANPEHSGAAVAQPCAVPTCCRCGARLTQWVRQGFLRRSASARVVRHDHSP